tara:strand:- start:362 stop:1672 length:1311 start_codon:yes stop_codon:yes gene_type:complete
MASTHLTRTISSTSTPTKLTCSFWVKRTGLGSTQRVFSQDNDSSNRMYWRFDSGDVFSAWCETSSSTWSTLTTNMKFRDVGFWYHICIKWDSTQSTSTDRMKMFVNGENIDNLGGYSGYTAPTQNSTFGGFSSTNCKFDIGYQRASTNEYFDGILSHVHVTDGYAYDASSFGSTDATTGEWQISAGAVANYGTNGFFILKDGNSVTDQSPNTNNFTVGGGTLTKTEDCPSNVFCTINPLTQEHTGSTIGYSSGNTNIFFDQTGQWWHTTSTLGAITGKYYAECKIDAVGGECSLGIISSDSASLEQGSGDYMGKEADSISYFNNGRTMKANSDQQTGLTALSSGTIVGIAMDLDNNTVQFYINGSAEGNAVSLTADKFYLFGCSGYSDTRFYWNFGNGYFNTTAISSEGTNASGIGKFEYNVPANHTALCTKGLNE